MAGITIGELRDYINNLDLSVKALIEKLDQLDPTTDIVTPASDKCLPIWLGGWLFQYCDRPLPKDDGTVKVQSLIEALDKLESWLKDMHTVVRDADPDTALPPNPDITDIG